MKESKNRVGSLQRVALRLVFHRLIKLCGAVPLPLVQVSASHSRCLPVRGATRDAPFACDQVLSGFHCIACVL
jgi:hypothetical protein